MNSGRTSPKELIFSIFFIEYEDSLIDDLTSDTSCKDNTIAEIVFFLSGTRTIEPADTSPDVK